MAAERKHLMRRLQALKTERSSWEAHWQEIARQMMPRAGRFAEGRGDRGGKKHNNIIDNTPILAARTLGAGMMAGATSPARPWFRLTTSDPKLDESAAIKQWLHDVGEVMRMVFTKSNTYRALHSCYDELGAFGTCATVVEPDFESVINHRPQTAGEFYLATNHKGRPDTLFREFDMTVEQMVQSFGLAACSTQVRNLYERRSYDELIRVIHAIEPRHDRDPGKRDSKNMAWRSVYFEEGREADAVLRESGFKDFPALCARWVVHSNDVYGASPGMDALGDCKQLQHQQRRKGQAIDYQVTPPLQVPGQHKLVDYAPGGITFVDAVGPNNAIRSLFDVNLNLAHLREDIQDVRQRINSAFYADMFLMLYNRRLDDPRMTATEVAERHEEKLLMIGPVLERLHDEMLSPLIEMAFSRMVEAGILPPPPQELQGRELNVEFVSVLAQAQRAVATSSVDRFVMSLGQIAQMKPDVLDKLNADAWADKYADMLGVDPELVVSGEQVVLVRQQRAQAQQAAQEAAMAEQAAGAAAKLGSVNTGEPNALTDVMSAFSGYT